MEHNNSNQNFANRGNRITFSNNIKILMNALLMILVIFGTFILVLWLFMDRENPKVKYRISNHAASYINDTYPDNDFIIGEPEYSFMRSYNDSYLVEIHSQSSMDTYFSLFYSVNGDFTGDTYERNVTSGLTTRCRLQNEYETMIETALSSIQGITYIQADLSGLHELHLELDGQYDVGELGATYGDLIIFLDVPKERVNFDDTVALFLEIDKILQESGAAYHLMEIEVTEEDVHYSVAEDFCIYDVTPEMLHCDEYKEQLYAMWEAQEQHRLELKEQWASTGK